MMTILQECKNLLAKEASVTHKFKVGDKVSYNGEARGTWADHLDERLMTVSSVSRCGSSCCVRENGFTFHISWLDHFGTVVFEGEV